MGVQEPGALAGEGLIARKPCILVCLMLWLSYGPLLSTYYVPRATVKNRQLTCDPVALHKPALAHFTDGETEAQSGYPRPPVRND